MKRGVSFSNSKQLRAVHPADRDETIFKLDAIFRAELVGLLDSISKLLRLPSAASTSSKILRSQFFTRREKILLDKVDSEDVEDEGGVGDLVASVIVVGLVELEHGADGLWLNLLERKDLLPNLLSNIRYSRGAILKQILTLSWLSHALAKTSN